MYEDVQRGFLSEDCNLKHVPIDTPETHVDALQREEQSKSSYQLRGFKVNVHACRKYFYGQFLPYKAKSYRAPLPKLLSFYAFDDQVYIFAWLNLRN